MGKIQIIVNEEIFIDRSPETVWDYTQDFSKRLEWDKSLIKVNVLQEIPVKTVDIKAKGNFTATLVYKLYDRPNKTSLVFTNVKSPVINGGGGSWRYEKMGNGTLWTQMGSCILKSGMISRLSLPFLRFMLRYNMRTAMKLAKKNLECN
jgi:hypothetical protein